jgi:phosphoribosylformylglycinamidine (FGAM) synthase PurS component
MEKVGRVRIGKVIEIELPDGADESLLHEISRDLLSNPVIEDYELRIQ